MGAFHGGISEQWNYMLAGYRCKAVPRYKWRRNTAKEFPVKLGLQSETPCTMTLPRGSTFSNHPRFLDRFSISHQPEKCLFLHSFALCLNASFYW